MLEYSSAEDSATKYPGVAKFGIALEWGSRGLEFESRHSDQKIQNSICCSGFFYLWRDSKIKCDAYERRLPPVSTAATHLSASIPGRGRKRISTLGPKKQEQYLLFLLFTFVSGFEESNAMRTSITCRRLFSLVILVKK